MVDQATHPKPTPPAATDATEPRYLPDPLGREAPTSPSWFRSAVSVEPAVGEVEVEGARIRYLRWPGGTGPATILVHGGSANAQWWAPLAPSLRFGGPVVAMDLSGHGLSDWRPEGYTVAQWACEVRAVALSVARSASAEPPTVVAHSMGGIVSAHLAVTAGEAMGRLIVVDAPVWDSAPGPGGDVASRAKMPIRYHADPEGPVSRFKLIPPQDCHNDYYLRHVAWHGLTHTSEGYRWRFDPRIFASNGGGASGENRIARFEGSLADSACPYAVIMGEDSYLTPHALKFFNADTGPADASHHNRTPTDTRPADASHHDRTPADTRPPSASRHSGTPLVLVPSAGHHVMLDQPLPLIAAIRGLLAGWR